MTPAVMPPPPPELLPLKTQFSTVTGPSRKIPGVLQTLFVKRQAVKSPFVAVTIAVPLDAFALAKTTFETMESTVILKP